MSEVVVKRDAGFRTGLALAVAYSLLTFAPLCHSSTIPVSDGSDGIFQPPQDVMLDLAPDAVFNFSSITIESAISVGFNRNGSNVPIYFLATGDILINGMLDGGMGPLYIATPGSITINGDLSGEELILSAFQIVFSSDATINTNTTTQPDSTLSLRPGSRLLLDRDGSIQIAPVPVPPSFVLLFTGLIPMWLAGRFRFRRIGQSEA